MVIDFDKYMIFFGGESSNSKDLKQNKNHMKFWLTDVNGKCLLCERGEERELVAICLPSLLHFIRSSEEHWTAGSGQRNMVPIWLHRAEQCQWDFGLILAAVFMGQG